MLWNCAKQEEENAAIFDVYDSSDAQFHNMAADSSGLSSSYSDEENKVRNEDDWWSDDR